MLLKKSTIYVFGIVFYIFLLVQGAIAQEVTVELVQNFTSVTPTYLSGHEGEVSMISGFSYQSDLLYEGIPIGTASGEILLSDPPFNPSVSFNDITIDGVWLFPGAGTINFTGSGIIFAGRTWLRTGELAISLMGRYSEGTDVFSDYNGVGAGIGIVSLFTRQGSANITLYIQP
ncbi:MAG: hypothetical protein JRG73_06215 [Deltaproteobacteria bacterium]|nr:hypothetical protein [Deltaproteobacteria bacterium]